MEYVEEKIREKLATNLNILNDGLSLISQEAFLRNSQGTRGFVDLLATDSDQRYVLIELKRSKAASREAIHEIFKYIEGIKENKSLKNDEIVAYIVSTEWDELIVPFSSFVSKVSYDVIGFNLIIDDEFNPVSAERVKPLNLENERFISDQHAICLYSNKNTLNQAIQSYISCFKEKNVEDYVLLILKAHPDYYERSIVSTLHGLENIASYHNLSSSMTYEELKERMPEFKFMIYSATQVLSNDKYWEILKNDRTQYEEAIDVLEGVGAEELSHSLHEYAIECCQPRPFQEFYEIGYPAKLRHTVLENDQWEIIDLLRFGRLKENVMLSDETLLNELKGDAGTNKQIYSKDFNSENQASFEQIEKEVKKCLVDNDIWLSGILKSLSELYVLSSATTFQGRIHIFNPSNTLLSIYRAASSSSAVDAMQWIPSYYVNIESDEVQRSYFGCLTANDNSTTLDDVIAKAYGGTTMLLLLTLNWGGYESNDIDISPLYGLEYTNFMCEIINEERIFYKFDGFRYKLCNELDPFRDFFYFLKNKKNFVNEVIKLFKDATLTQGIVHFN